jgi:hypothetical protein
MEETVKAKEAKTEVDEVKEVKEESKTPDMKEVLKGRPNAPDQEQIDKWKNAFGDVFVSGFSEDELYIWRTLNRMEFKKLQTMLADPKLNIDEFRYQELICEYCVLWPSVDAHYWSTGKAGTPGTITEQIMQNSNFMPPSTASMLVAKL